MLYLFRLCDLALVVLIASIIPIPELRAAGCCFGRLMNLVWKTGYENWWADAIWPVGIIVVFRAIFAQVLPPRSHYASLAGSHHLMLVLLGAAGGLIVLNAVYHVLIPRHMSGSEQGTPWAS